MNQLLNKSFSRRIGKTLSVTQKHAIENMLPNYLLNTESLESDDMVVEIGIGMGEHFIAQATRRPNILHIGFEPYLNGIANTLLLAEKQNIKNIALWPDDVDLVFKKLHDNSINEIYILFPDPWPKTKQKKRRIICAPRLEIFAKKLKKNGKIYFASDIEDYVDSVKKLISQSKIFVLNKKPENVPHDGYIATKYHKKAAEEGRSAQFLEISHP